MMGRDGLEGCEGVERLEPLLATVARFSDAAEGQFDPARRAVVVDEDLSGPQPFRQPHLPSAVGGPDTVRRKLADFIALTGVDELMVTGMMHDNAARIRSLEIVADARATLDAADAA